MLDFNPAREPGYYLHNEYPTAGEKLDVRRHGKLYDLLGSHEFDEASFRRMTAGLHPETGKKLTARLKKDREEATDVTATVPKELAVIIGVAGDQRAKDAMWLAWEDTFKKLERDACCRVRAGGKGGNRVTGNLACDSFFHETTRPTKEDGLPDPHPHIHGHIKNLTYDRAEGKVKAAKLDYIDKPKMEKYFHTRLAKRLREIGYDARVVKAKEPSHKHVRQTGTTVRIKGIDKEIVDRFSRRHFEVEKDAERRGYKSAKAKATLAQATRQEKNSDITMADVKKYWVSRISVSQFHSLEKMVAKSKVALRRSAWRENARNFLDRVRQADRLRDVPARSHGNGWER